jgi:hypothetical protein
MGVYGWADANRDDDEWARGYAEQTELLSAQLTALRAGPPGVRRRFRALEYVCGACGDVVLEVFKTSPYWTLCTWSTDPHPDASPVTTTDATDYQRRRAEQGSALRQGDHLFRPLPDPLPEPAAGHRSIVPAICRCQSRTLTEAMVISDLMAKTKKRSLPDNKKTGD